MCNRYDSKMARAIIAEAGIRSSGKALTVPMFDDSQDFDKILDRGYRHAGKKRDRVWA